MVHIDIQRPYLPISCKVYPILHHSFGQCFFFCGNRNGRWIEGFQSEHERYLRRMVRAN